jgi:hypothetical protein
MNNAFSKNSKIELDDNHYLEPDSDNGVILVFSEIREREKTTKEGGKTIKTGIVEEYLFEDRSYHTRIAQALKFFIDKTQNESKTLEELMFKVNYNSNLLERLDKTFKQFE